MNIRAIKTADSISAVNRIKAMTLREVKDVDTSVPNIFLEKRNYMQSDEFLKDEHNQKMFGLIDELMEIRDNIALKVRAMNKATSLQYVQGINGFTRLKSSIDKDFALNFSEEPMLYTPLEGMYKLVRSFKLSRQAQKVK